MESESNRSRRADGSGWIARLALLTGAVLALGLTAGCSYFRATPTGPSSPTPQKDTSTEESEPGRSDSVFDRPFRRIDVRFTVLRVSAPRGAFTGDDALWKLVSTPIPSAEVAMRLADNGFRAAIGAKSDRESLLRYLERIAEPRTALDDFAPNESRLLELDFGPGPERQTIFYIDRTGKLHGRTFEDPRPRLRLEYEMRSISLDEVWIRLMPEIQESPGPWKWEITEHGAREVQEERRHAFRDLVFEARIQEGGFLLLGPTADLCEQPLLAKPYFLQSAKDDTDLAEARETIFVISPIISSREHSATSDGENH